MKTLGQKKLLMLLLFSLLALIPITDYSLWIDESSTAYFASQDTIHDLSARLFSSPSSEIQMPGYIYYMWTWVKLFGHSEYALRLSNLPFVILLFLAIFYSPLSGRLKILYAALIILCPFLWYNLNEARATVPIFTFGGISIIALTYYFQGGRSDKKLAVSLLSASIIVGATFNMLFVLFIPVLGILFIWQIHVYRLKLRTILLDWWPGLLVIAILIIPVTLYYLWTLDKGSGGFRETPGIMNTGFVLYEHLGFSGLGPPRNILRNSFSIVAIKPYLPFIGLYSLLYLIIFVSVYIKSRRDKEHVHFFLNPYLVSYIGGVSLFSIVSFVFDFRFLGRHAAFLLPLLLFFFAQMTDQFLVSHPSKWCVIIFSSILLMTLMSDINLRFNEAYKKENNKEAALMAIQSADADGTIVWSGFERLAEYYGLDINAAEKSQTGSWKVTRKAVKPTNDEYENSLSDYLDSLKSQNSVLIVFNRPEFDPGNHYRDYVKRNTLKLIYKHRDFSIYSLE